jgi:NAD(P)H dehydrogenase (quinone)
MSNKETVLVYGATGAQGAPIVARLGVDGYAVRGISRNGTGHENASFQNVRADLDDAKALEQASRDVAKVVFMLPLSFDVDQTARWTENAISAAAKAGVELFVFNTSAPVPDIAPGVAAIDLKVRAERIVKDADVPSIILRPTIYLGNLLAPWSAPSIVRDHVLAYPLPADIAVAWTSWDDVAEAIARLLQRPELAGSTFDLGGPEALDGEALAKALGQGMGEDLHYASIPLPAFEAGLTQAMGPDVGREIARLYGWFAGDGRSHTGQTGEAATRVLGLSLVTAEAWARKQDWQAASRPGDVG